MQGQAAAILGNVLTGQNRPDKSVNTFGEDSPELHPNENQERPGATAVSTEGEVHASAQADTFINPHPDFDLLVTQYRKKIFNVIYRFLGDYEEAVDLTQETFISAFRHYDRFRGDAKVFTWLYQIARNLCINRVRQRERQRSLRIESLDQPRENDEDEGMTREIADLSQAPHTLLERKELQQRLKAAIDALPPDYKEVVLLREYHNLSYNEIVEATGLTLENVKTRLSRARAMLRRKLEPYYRM